LNSRRKARLTVTVDAELVAADYEAEFGELTPAELAEQDRKDRANAATAGGITIVGVRRQSTPNSDAGQARCWQRHARAT